MRFPISAATKNFGYVVATKKRTFRESAFPSLFCSARSTPNSPSPSLFLRKVTGAVGQGDCACYTDIAVDSKGEWLGNILMVQSRATSAGSSLSCWKGGA